LIKGGKVVKKLRDLLEIAEVQAVLAIGLTAVVAVLAFMEKIDPNIVATGWSAIIFFYFGQKSAQSR